MKVKSLNNSTLVPVDFSESSLNALEHAAAIAQIMDDDNQEITLLHVIEGVKMPRIREDSDLSNLDRHTSLMVEGSKTRLEKIKNRFQEKFKTPINQLITGGKPYKKIAKIAEEINADSIVMGTQGGSSWSTFMGSNASKVIQVSPCPVVVVNEKQFGKGYRNIVLPLDLTKETKQKVSIAVKVADFFNARVHLVSVAEDDKYLKKRVKSNMKQVENYLDKYEIENSSEILTETSQNFANATLEFAKNKEADLLIIMTQQEKTFSEMIIGSYAQQIVSKSQIPVMCVNPRQDLRGIFERLSPSV